MKSVAAGKFKDQCLKLLETVMETREPIIVTKRGRPVAKLVPISKPASVASLKGSILEENGDPFGTREIWDADRT